jgi:Tfp pilus assembly protein PilP
MRRPFGWVAILWLLAGLVVMVSAQEEEEPAGESEAPAQSEEQLEQQILGSAGTPNDVSGSLSGARDPFQPVFDTPRADGPTVRRPRPPGIEGMDVQELELVGIVELETDSIAFFNGTDNLGYFLRVGDRVYDGKLVRIDRDKVVFEQEISGAPGRRTREVTKRLRPLT